MSRFYTITISGVASPAAAFDFVEISPAANKNVKLHRIRIAQTSEPTTEEEQLAISVIRGHTTSGSGGSAPTPVPLSPSDAAAGFTVEVMNTTIASAGTAVTPVDDAWNTRAGYDMAFAPEEAPECINGVLLVVRSGAPADAVTIRGAVWVEEI